MGKTIKVVIVDDSAFFREFLSRALSADPAITVVGTASDAFEAMDKIAALRPDVVTMDIEMPRMRGTDFLKQALPHFPGLQALAISSVSKNVFEALQAGAIDFVQKPNPTLDNNAFIKQVLEKIKLAATVTALRPPASTEAPAATANAATNVGTNMWSRVAFPNPKSVIAIGASTGGTEAILAVVRELPANTPGIVMVQHMPPVFTKMYAERLDKACKMRVFEAKDGDRVEPGVVLLAEGGDKHMRLRSDARGYYVRCEPGKKISGHTPSVDALFESVAQTAKANAVGVLLTGMGADGAKHLLSMRRAGAYTIGQDQNSCVVYGMPMVAYNMGAVVDQLPLHAIAEAIVRKLSKGV